MSGTPESALADPDQVIADLQRQLAECKAELDQRTAELDAFRREPVDSGEQQTAQRTRSRGIRYIADVRGLLSPERPRLHQGLGDTLDLLPTILAPRRGSLSWAGRPLLPDQRQSSG